MGIIRIKPAELDSLATKLKSVSATVSEAEALAASVEANLAMEVSGKANILAKINTAKSELKTRKESLTALSKASSTGAGLYKKADKSKLKVIGIPIISQIMPSTKPVIRGGAMAIVAGVATAVAVAGISAIIRKIFEVITINPINSDATTQEIQNIINGATDGGSASTNSDSSYRGVVDAINQKNPPSQAQQRNINGKGLCTYVSVTSLINRKRAMEGKDTYINFETVYKTVHGDKGKQRADGRWTFSSKEFDLNTYNKFKWEGDSYSFIKQDGAISQDNLKGLLDQHPEGIMIYGKYTGGEGGNHAIVITDYEMVNGKIQFYADDGVVMKGQKGGRKPLEETWMYSVCKKNINEMLNSLYFVSYIA